MDKLLDNDTHSIVIYMERVPASKLHHFLAKRKRPHKPSKDDDKNEEEEEERRNEPMAKKQKVETWIEDCNAHVCSENTRKTSQTNLDEPKEPSSFDCTQNLPFEALRLMKEQILHELLKAVSEDETEETSMALSDEKINQSPLENNQKSKYVFIITFYYLFFQFLFL